MWQFAGGGTYGLSMKMGEREVADIQGIITPTGVDRDTEPKPYRSSPQQDGDCQAFGKTPTSFSFIYNAELKILPKLFQEGESQTVLNKLCRVVTRRMPKFLSFCLFP